MVVTYHFASGCPLWRDLPNHKLVSLVQTRIRGKSGWFVYLDPHHRETWQQLLEDPEVQEEMQRLNTLIEPPYVICPVTPNLGEALEFAYFALKKRRLSFASIWLLCTYCRMDDFICSARKAILGERRSR